jgi:hypothetical protein
MVEKILNFVPFAMIADRMGVNLGLADLEGVIMSRTYQLASSLKIL